MSHDQNTLDSIEDTLGLVPQWMVEMPESALPGLWATMRDFQLSETAIPNKYKELIGVALSGATRCRYCALFHTEAARFFGATDEEIAEASMMGAWTMAASTFVNAQQTDYDAFEREVKHIIAYLKGHTETATSGNGGSKKTKPSASRAHA